jgi:alpha-galactosidase
MNIYSTSAEEIVSAIVKQQKNKPTFVHVQGDDSYEFYMTDANVFLCYDWNINKEFKVETIEELIDEINRLKSYT